jgi:hypothetical protein
MKDKKWVKRVHPVAGSQHRLALASLVSGNTEDLAIQLSYPNRSIPVPASGQPSPYVRVEHGPRRAGSWLLPGHERPVAVSQQEP